MLRLLGDFDRAEEALHDAFAAALERWPADGVPQRPRAWLVSAGRFAAIDTLRRRARYDDSLGEVIEELASAEPRAVCEGDLADDDLRLIFLCCHPALPLEARIALTLREACGLSTEEIARAFLVSAATLAQRIVRAKARLGALGLPLELPPRAELTERLDGVLRVVYLVFNEGYSASHGPELVRADLAREALRLARRLAALLPEPEVQGLLALFLLLDARRAARTSSAGDFVLLDDQDRALWNREQIAAGAALVESSLRSRRFGPYTLQAAIAAVHAEATSAEATDWAQIAGLYDLLVRIDPSPVIALNRAVAVAQRNGPAAGLALVDALLQRGELATYALGHATRADLCRRLGRGAEARAAYERALALTSQARERAFLASRLQALDAV